MAASVPDEMLSLVFRNADRSDTGVLLDRQMQAMIRVKKTLGVASVERLSAADARRESLRQAYLASPPPRAVSRVETRFIVGPGGAMPVRLYVPRASLEPLPALVYFHGGGWVVGDLDTHDSACRLLASVGDCIVIGVHYRLAPEDKFPAAVEDSIVAYHWAHGHATELGADPERVAVGGDSAGGNLAAVVCQQVKRDSGPLPCLQLLVYPVTDLTRSLPSHQTFADGYLLTQSSLDWYFGHYLRRSDDKTDPRASPLLCDDLAGLPPALIVTAGFDPLRDEGHAYAERLREAGVEVDYRCEEHLVHGFVNMGGLVRAAHRANERIARSVGDALRRPR